MTNLFFSRPDDPTSPPPVDSEIDQETLDHDTKLRSIGDWLFDILKTWLIIVVVFAIIIIGFRVVVAPSLWLANLVS